jgi:hypothetical protein
VRLWHSQPLPLPPSDERLTGREWLALGLGALTLTMLVVVAEPSTFGSTDWVRMHGPYKAYLQSSLAQGRLPLWNPHHWLGRPFLADIESAFFYPPDWLYLVLDLRLACALTCALHCLLLLYGTVRLLRALGATRGPSLFVAFVLASSAPIVGCFTSGLVHYGQSLCYVPVVLYLGLRVQAGPHRRDAALLALALGLQVLCGHPQAAWLTEVALAVFLLGRRLGRPLRPALAGLATDLLVAAGALGLGLALAGVALLPFAELVSQGNRPAGSVAFASWFSEPWFGWATLLVPTRPPAFTFQANGQLYAGLVPLIAGFCGLSLVRERNLRALGLLAVFSALLAAGDRTPFFRLFFHTIPGVGWLRIQSRATVLVTLAVVLAAGLFLSRSRSKDNGLRVAAITIGAGVVGVGFCLAWPGYGSAAVGMAMYRGLATGLAGGALLLWTCVGETQTVRRRILAAAFVVLTAADLGVAMRDLKGENRAASLQGFVDKLHARLAEQGLLAPGTPPPRVFLPAPCENAGMTAGWSSVQGYSALALGRVWRHMYEVLGFVTPLEENTFPSPRLASFGPFPYRSMSLVIGVDPHTQRIVYNPRPDPRAYLATSVRYVHDDGEATSLMRQGHDFHATALMEQPVDLPATPAPQAGRATIARFEPERIAVEAESPTPALLVLAEPWFPGWSARVNGTPAPCLPANAWMRAVPVPAGKSEVVLTFESRYLAGGVCLSLAALVGILAMLLGRGDGRLV